MTVQRKTAEGPITTEELARTPEVNEMIRQQMADELAAYLQTGGAVTEVKQGHRADPPRKPENKYGSRPI
ncbi:hypothetical protein [Reinekea sp.]|jgi:hypothetical protein|uniref:hypothetical protein n=1 Tax=Reinekea sp. TaxID=1970455 RepID=UPI002A81AB51|nr:hypothetical protein [Reinekea sp.]